MEHVTWKMEMENAHATLTLKFPQLEGIQMEMANSSSLVLSHNVEKEWRRRLVL